MENFDIYRVLKFMPGIIIGLTVHEFSHAWVAQMCGDTTSKDEGRVTLNPFKHIDLIGFIFLIFVGFGWAKPVQFNEENLRNPKTDVFKIALAGPFSNAIIAMLLSVIYIFLRSKASLDTHYLLSEILFYSIYINWGLFVFNLIPIPPLDGSHLVFHPLRRYPELYTVLYRYGSMLFFILLVITAVTKLNLLPILPMIRFFAEGFFSLFGYS